jgi:hypothetical protein
MLTNSQNDTLVSALKALGTLANADAAFAKKVDAMREAGFTAAMLDKKSDMISEIREVTARALLSTKEYPIWVDASLASKVTDKATGKRVNTQRGTLINRVDQSITRLQTRMNELETVKVDIVDAVDGDAKGAAKGAKANAPRDLKTRVVTELGTLAKAVTKDATAETPTLTATQRVELLAAFGRIFDILK